MKKKKNLILFLITLFLIIITTFIRSNGGLILDVPLMFSIFTISGFTLVKTRYAKAQHAAAGIIASILLIYIIAFVVDSLSTVGGPEWVFISIGTPNFIMAMAGVTCGAWLAYSINKRHTVVVSILATIVCFTFSIWYYKSLHVYWFNYVFDDSFTGKVTETVKDNSWYVISQNNDTIKQDYYRDKIVLFDFWSTTCGVCFKKFPDIERIYQQYKNRPGFVLNAVNIPIKRDTAGMAFAMMEKYGNTYSFPVFVADSTMRSTFAIEGFPKVIIMKNNEIVFRGRVELAEGYLAELLGN